MKATVKRFLISGDHCEALVICRGLSAVYPAMEANDLPLDDFHTIKEIDGAEAAEWKVGFNPIIYAKSAALFMSKGDELEARLERLEEMLQGVKLVDCGRVLSKSAGVPY